MFVVIKVTFYVTRINVTDDFAQFTQ